MWLIGHINTNLSFVFASIFVLLSVLFLCSSPPPSPSFFFDGGGRLEGWGEGGGGGVDIDQCPPFYNRQSNDHVKWLSV